MSDDARLPSLSLAVAAWVPAFGVLGTAGGTLLQLIGQVEGVAPTALRMAAAGALFGALAGWLDQRRAARRPALADGRGELRYHGDAWVLVVPLLVASAGFAVLVVLATVQAESALLGGGFLAASLLSLGFARPVWTRMRLARAAEALVLGDRDGAAEAWSRLVSHPLCTRSGRIQAHLNLGLSRMLAGRFDEAEHHYSRAGSGAAAGFAQTGVALIRVLRGDFAGAERAVGAASGAGRGVQSELQGVRLLLVLRRDGAPAAVELAERLHSDASGSLFLGVFAAACRATHQVDRSRDLLGRGVAEALAASGLDRVIPEVGEACAAREEGG